jgi:hypothetical protein
MSNITLTITAEDFDRLTNTSMEWKANNWQSQANRFEDEPLFTWEMAYWCGTFVETLLCQGYLSGIGQESQTVFDTGLLEWVILTNYRSSHWITQ